MRITIDLDLGKAVIGRGTTQLIDTLNEKRSTMAVLEVEFIRNNVIQELPLDATGKLGLKLPGEYDMNPLTGAAAWTKFGTGTSTYYRLAYALINDALDAMFGVDSKDDFTATAATDLLSATASPAIGSTVQLSTTDTLPAPLVVGKDYFVLSAGHTTTDWKVSETLNGTLVDITDTGTGTHSFVQVNDDVASVTLMGEVSWRYSSQDYKTQTISFVIANDVNRDADTIPPSPAIVYVRDSFIRHGSGVPDDSVGVDGDAYINDDTGDLYFRDAGVYTLDFNINGQDSGFRYKFNTATSGDPGSGKFLFNNATFASATQFNISETDQDSTSLAAFLALQDNSTSANKCLVIARKQDGTPIFLFYITAALTDAGSYDTFPITPVSTSGSIANNDVFRLTFLPVADKGDAGTTGATGATPAVTQNYSTTTTDSDPGSGIFRFNNTTIASVTAAYLDNNEVGGNSITALLDSFDDSTSTVKGVLIFRGVTAPTAFAIFAVSGTVVDGTGYRKLTLTYISRGGTFTNTNLFSFAFYRTGNVGAAGADGADGGTTYDAPATIPSGATPTVDLSTTAMSTLRLLAANTTITFSNPVAGKTSILHFKQAAASSFTVDMPDIDHWVGTGGIQPVMSAAFDTVDAYTVWYDGSDYYASWAPGV